VFVCAWWKEGGERGRWGEMKEEGPRARVPTASEVLSLNIPLLDSGGPL
jgi:hypothetical protein